MMNNDEYNRQKEEYIKQHIFRQMRKQCKQEFFERLKNKNFEYETFRVLTDLIYLTINAIFETIANEGK